MNLGNINLKFTDANEALPDDDREVVCLVKVPDYHGKLFNGGKIIVLMASWKYESTWFFHGHLGGAINTQSDKFEVLGWADMDFSSINLPGDLPQLEFKPYNGSDTPFCLLNVLKCDLFRAETKYGTYEYELWLNDIEVRFKPLGKEDFEVLFVGIRSSSDFDEGVKTANEHNVALRGGVLEINLQKKRT